MTAKLKIISEKWRGKTFELNSAKTSVGRDKLNQIVLNDASVSRRHCIIERRGEAFFISDAGSLNGTTVNGREAFETELAGGDRIDVGDFVFSFLTEDAPEDSSGVFFDKTEFRLPKNSVQLKIEEVFGAMARDLTALLRISAVINAIRDPETLQKELLRQIFDVIPAHEGAILLVDSENEPAEIVGLNRRDDAEWVNVSQTIVNRVLAARQVILVGELESSAEDFKEAESLFLRKVSSMLCVPIVLFEKTLGAIYLSGSKTNFDEGHLKFLTAVAGIAAVAIENARNFAFLESENARLRGETLSPNLLGESPAMRKVFEIIQKVAPTDSTVLITGESGTGKERAAQTVHLNSRRSARPFVAINCAALTEALLESELFGHEKGAFTGATAQKKGKLEMAEGGTLFLDEIGEMAPNLQAKLLRVLQEREFERVGGLRPIKTDVRLIAATNRDLPAEVKNGAFRQDLFYRLNVVRLTMPPLRERKDDVLPLADSFIEKFSRALNRPIRGISAGAKKLLLRYDFPGNVRELENAIERAAVLGSGEWVRPEDLPEDFLALNDENAAETVSKYHAALREKKIALIRDAFREARGNYVETAKILDIHPNYLHRLIRNLEIKADLENEN